MRKFAMLLVVAVVPALGCECLTEPLRRIEVWKLQTFYASPQPVVVGSPGSVCGPKQLAEAPCGGNVADADCGSGSTVPAVTGFSPDSPAADSSDETIPGPVLTEEGDGVLKQP
jgi:hypothetical protein